MFKNPFSFNGRIRRLEYGLSTIIYFIYLVIAGIIMMLSGLMTEEGGNKEILIFYLICSLRYILLLRRVSKDVMTGTTLAGIYWFLFIGFWMLFADGDIGDNEYGPNPKGLSYEDEEPEQNSVTPIDDVDEDGIIKPEK